MAPILDKDIESSDKVDKLLCVCDLSKITINKTNEIKDNNEDTQNTADNNDNNQAIYNSVQCLQWSPNGKYLASAGNDCKISIWHWPNDQLIEDIICSNTMPANTCDKYNVFAEQWILKQQLIGHTKDINSISWSISGILASVGCDFQIRVWQEIKDRFKCVMRINDAHNHWILGISFDPINEYLVTQSAFGDCKVWNLKQLVVDVNATSVQTKVYKEMIQLKDDFRRRSDFTGNTNDEQWGEYLQDVPWKPSWIPDGSYFAASFGLKSESNLIVSPIYRRELWMNMNGKCLAFVGHQKPTTVTVKYYSYANVYVLYSMFLLEIQSEIIW